MAEPDSTHPAGIAAPIIRQRTGISLVWLIPLVTLIIGGWLMAEAGKKVMLQAKHLGSLDMGSPVYYQGLIAGEVLGYELANISQAQTFDSQTLAEKVRASFFCCFIRRNSVTY